MPEYIQITVERLRELEELEEMHKQVEEDGKSVDAWIQQELEMLRKGKAETHART
jgi:hypothetical protein